MTVTRKEILLLLLVLGLGGWYVWRFTGWFRPKIIRIEHSARPLREAWTGSGQRADPAGKQANNVTFSLHEEYRLTSVRVVRAGEFRTNQHALSVWELVSKPGSAPVKSLSYGVPVPGMAPSVPGAVAEPLQRGVVYCLVVEARSGRGEHEFSIPATPGLGR